ncbi:hypothetical protein CAL14_15720 [Bordetella genomosp. 9]|uniref:hypothetical protein n=1 Tax=Bordetella genomosp. 9 TaxID=1416803 RepID=UPI000A293055|nr:hypothetical protein [Bordetella genomosp. 9]ARP91553.1 hypothetical protein CAL14_15720 [Bordetella genomosp. 9]
MPESSLGCNDFADIFFKAYKPFRNYVRRLALEDSLLAIWAYSSYLAGDLKLPSYLLGAEPNGQPFDLRRYIYQWELTLLAREVLLHASMRGDVTLRTRKVLARVMNSIKDLSSFDPELDKIDQLLLHMHRLAHQQFPVQRGTQMGDLMRYKLIFEHASVKDLFEAEMGLSASKFYFLGWAVAGALKSRPGYNTSTDFSAFGISGDERDKFYSRLVGSLELIRTRILEKQRFGSSWAFTINPLENTPLVRIDPAPSRRVFGPIPALVLSRITSGVYYDLVSKKGFGDGFGPAFDDYIGLVMRKCFGAGWDIYDPEPFRVGKDLHHGTDWILSDATANIFIECKAARIKADARSAETPAEIEATVDQLAKMIVQNYVNISHAMAGRTAWVANTRPTYNLVVTLEDFLPFGGAVTTRVQERVFARLHVQNLGEALVQQIPYFVVSSAEFEGICTALRNASAQQLFSEKSNPHYSDWLFSSFLHTKYRTAWSESRQLLKEEFAEWREQVDHMSRAVRDGRASAVPSP